VSNKLEYPTDNEESERPAPVEKEQRQRDDNHRYADAVREPVQRVLMLGFVVGEKILRHKSLPIANFRLPNEIGSWQLEI